MTFLKNNNHLDYGPTDAISPRSVGQMWMQRWLLLGLWWLWVGMAIAPVGEKVWNPGRPYHWSLLVVFLPPALWLVWRKRALLNAVLTASAESRWLLLLLAWALLAQWHGLGRLDDVPTVFFSLLVFIGAWVVIQVEYPSTTFKLLFWSGVGLAAAAAIAMLSFHFRDVIWDRLIAFGTLNNPNLAGFVFGMAIIWLMQLPVRGIVLRWVHGIAIVILGAAVLATFSRAAWLALLVSQGTMLLSRQRHVRLRSMVFMGLAVLAVALGGFKYMEQRGFSYRPQILLQAIDLIRVHPWMGLGVDGKYMIRVDDQVWLHSHNVLTHLAITIGVPGALLWLGLWLHAGWRGFCLRHQAAGQLLLATWLYGIVACQFDAPHLFQQPDVEWVLLWLPLAMSVALGVRDGVRRAEAALHE